MWVERLSILVPLLDEGSDWGGIRRPPDRPADVRTATADAATAAGADREDPKMEAPF